MVQVADFYFGQFVLRLSSERVGRYFDMTIPLIPKLATLAFSLHVQCLNGRSG